MAAAFKEDMEGYVYQPTDTAYLCIKSWITGACTHEKDSIFTAQRQSEVVRGRGKIKESLASTPVNAMTVRAAWICGVFGNRCPALLSLLQS